MTVTFPNNALPSDSAHPRPNADVVFYQVLKAHPVLNDITIELAHAPSTRSSTWLRLQVVRYLEPYNPAGESTPICSVDIYSDDQLKASDLASRLVQAWPLLKHTTVGDPVASAYISGGWVTTEPYFMAEPAADNQANPISRVHLELGLRIHPWST